MSGIIHQSDNIYNSIQTMITTEESMEKLWIYFRANSLYVKLFKDHIREDARHRPKHLAPSRSSLCVEL